MLMLAALALGGCATVRPAASPGPLAELEPLYAATAGREGLSLSVGSNGCTARPDFSFYLERRGEAQSLAFARRKLDRCQSFAMGRTDIVFTWAELGVDPTRPVFLLNPVTAWLGP